MRWGFTGSQQGFPENVLLEELALLNLQKGDVVFTGGCVGVDSQVAHLVAKHYPEVKQVIVAPHIAHLPKYNQNKLDKKTFKLGIVFQLPMQDSYKEHPLLCYKDRNEKLVHLSDKMLAFKRGSKPRSGTQMTINMAFKVGKLHKLVALDD